MALTETENAPVALTQLQKQVWAKDCYMTGELLTDICEKVGCDSRTLNKWIAEHKWDRLRAQKSVNKGTVRIKLLTLMDASLEKAIQNEEFNAFSKEAMGFAKLLEQLEDEPIAQMAVAIFPLFRELLQNQQKHDPTITPDFIKKVDSLMDIFVKNNL